MFCIVAGKSSTGSLDLSPDLDMVQLLLSTSPLYCLVAPECCTMMTCYFNMIMLYTQWFDSYVCSCVYFKFSHRYGRVVHITSSPYLVLTAWSWNLRRFRMKWELTNRVVYQLCTCMKNLPMSCKLNVSVY